MLVRYRNLAPCALFAIWTTLLLTGWGGAGGWVHLFLVAALLLVPWKDLGSEGAKPGPPALGKGPLSDQRERR